MNVQFHPHAKERMAERGVTEREVIAAVLDGEKFPAKFGRTGFRRNLPFDGEWRGRRYATKQIEAFAAETNDGWPVITVAVRYF